MITDLSTTLTLLLVGLPGQRPGGLLLSVALFVVAGGLAVVAGALYAVATAALPRAAAPLQALLAVLRGVPPLLLVFLFAHLVPLSPLLAGLLALTAYSVSHTGEILRSFLNAYPAAAREHARIMGLGAAADWIGLRLPWVLCRSLPALTTHWISLLKDTGALIVIGVGELTTVAKLLSETSAAWDRWLLVLGLTSALYLLATLALLRLVPLAAGCLFPAARQPA